MELELVAGAGAVFNTSQFR